VTINRRRCKRNDSESWTTLRVRTLRERLDLHRIRASAHQTRHTACSPAQQLIPCAPWKVPVEALESKQFKIGLQDVIARRLLKVGFVGVDDPAVAPQRADIDWLMPGTQTLISFVCRMNQENIRTPARSISNLEFHIQTDETNVVAQKIVSRLEALKIRASIAGAAGFPMEADRFGGKPWTISHKPIAVAAGLGQMGIHRNVIHPKFGNFVLLGTVLLSAKLTRYTSAIEYNPCLECKLCVAACPTGAIHPDGQFDFSACYTHNYREFMGGFGDWVENIADSRSALDYRKKVSNAETQSMWQSLSYGAN
jgi:ferredoxin